ncbi:hypothetical protein Barb7_03176 [Bacteroidales bacterium Barb7]|nr:hypothetical protein Barb7_03176 [Bacteroidales bacterium Barb7]
MATIIVIINMAIISSTKSTYETYDIMFKTLTTVLAAITVLSAANKAVFAFVRLSIKPIT